MGLWLGTAALGLIVSIAGLALDTKHFLYAYLTAYTTVLTLVLGMLFFVMLHHVTDAGWSTVIRRVAEHFLAALPVLAVLLLPVLLGVGKIYKWADPAIVQGDPLYEVKRPFLNVPFFIVRAVAYLVAWWGLARLMRGSSLKQDASAEPYLSLRMRRWSGPGLVLFGVTFTLAAFDWLMSLDFHWYSTIFGVYVFACAAVASLGLLTLTTLRLETGPLTGLVARSHVHDLGKLVFAFCVFWAYIAFSQYFLIWYANIPEETIWMLDRWIGTWKAVSVLVPAGLFVIPFLALISAPPKMHRPTLASIGAIVLISHYVGMYWLVMPVLHHDGPPLRMAWIDAGALLLVAGACGAAVRHSMNRHAAYPINDPRLHEVVTAVEHEPGAEHVAEASAV
ncbi:MAG: membrane protein [Phycisphaerae bacterium]